MLKVSIQKQLPEYNLKIEFSVYNHILVLFGPSGCGKTTILRCIAGLVRPDSGTISLCDQAIYDSGTKVWLRPQNRRMGFMFQDYALFPHMNVERNILYGVNKLTADGHISYQKILNLFKLSHLTGRYPTELSGGEKQRVALARALMTEPQVLLLDEPLSALDNATRIRLQDELLEIQSLWQIPFILVTHDPNEAQKMGTEIIFMDQGQQVKKAG